MKSVKCSDGERVEFRASFRKEYVAEFGSIPEGQAFLDPSSGQTFRKISFYQETNAKSLNGEFCLSLFLDSAPVVKLPFFI